MSYESFTINYPKDKKVWNKLYGMNAIYAGKHWSKRREDAQFWHALTRFAMDRKNCRRKPFEKPVVIAFAWNDRMDLSNHAYMAKMIEDAMKGRIIKDDTRKYVKGIEHYYHDANNIRVLVYEIEENADE